MLGVAEMERALTTARSIVVLGIKPESRRERDAHGAHRNWSHEAARHTTIGFRLCVPGRAT